MRRRFDNWWKMTACGRSKKAIDSPDYLCSPRRPGRVHSVFNYRDEPESGTMEFADTTDSFDNATTSTGTIAFSAPLTLSHMTFRTEEDLASQLGIHGRVGGRASMSHTRHRSKSENPRSRIVDVETPTLFIIEREDIQVVGNEKKKLNRARRFSLLEEPLHAAPSPASVLSCPGKLEEGNSMTVDDVKSSVSSEAPAILSASSPSAESGHSELIAAEDAGSDVELSYSSAVSRMTDLTHVSYETRSSGKSDWSNVGRIRKEWSAQVLQRGGKDMVRQRKSNLKSALRKRPA